MTMKYISCFILLAMHTSALKLDGNVTNDEVDGNHPHGHAHGHGKKKKINPHHHMWESECRGRMQSQVTKRPLSCYFADCNGFYRGKHMSTEGGEKKRDLFSEPRIFWSKLSIWTMPIGAKYPRLDFAEGEIEFLRWGLHKHHNNAEMYGAATKPELNPYVSGHWNSDFPTSMQYYVLQLAQLIYKYSGYGLYLDWCDEDISDDNRRWKMENLHNKDWDDAHTNRVRRGLERATALTKVFVRTTAHGVPAGEKSAFCKAEEDEAAKQRIDSYVMEMPDLSSIEQALNKEADPPHSHVPNTQLIFDTIGEVTGLWGYGNDLFDSDGNEDEGHMRTFG